MTSETRSFYLQYNGDRRLHLIYVLAFQVLLYLTCIGIAAAGAADLVSGDTVGAGVLIGGLVALCAGVLWIAGAVKFKCKPRIWVDLDAETISYRHLVGDVLSFAEAERMRPSPSRLSQSWLVGPRLDMTGRINPKGSFGYSTGFRSRRRDSGQHFLAELLPAPFANMSDDLMIVDDLTWDDAFRFALLLNVRSLWNAGRINP